jgi:hypothetical protein
MEMPGRTRHSRDDQTPNLKPTLLTLNVGPHKLLVRLRQVNNSFDETNDGTNAARHQSDDDLDDSFCRVTEDEFVYTEAAEQDPANARDDLFVSAFLFPILH